MRIRRHRDFGREATALLASSFVLVCGLLVCVSIIFLFASDSSRPLLVMTGMLLGSAVLIWLLRDKPYREVAGRNFYWLTRKKPHVYLPRYRPQRKRNRHALTGPNRPPTVDSIRNLANGTNNWVPRSSMTDDQSSRQ